MQDFVVFRVLYLIEALMSSPQYTHTHTHV